jgi:antitoxin (DNA-binding transcriptional repressor) of toxin-antitoxin stability system
VGAVLVGLVTVAVVLDLLGVGALGWFLDLLRRVQAGELLAVTVNGRHVADVVPVQRSRRGWVSREVIVARLHRAQADPGLRADLAWIAEATDDLPPIR